MEAKAGPSQPKTKGSSSGETPCRIHGGRGGSGFAYGCATILATEPTASAATGSDQGYHQGILAAVDPAGTSNCTFECIKWMRKLAQFISDDADSLEERVNLEQAPSGKLSMHSVC
jgi:hypothetical protein